MYSYAHCKGKHLLPRSTTDRCQEGIYSSVDLYNSAPGVWTSLSGRVCTRDSILPVQIPVWRIKKNHRRVSCINVAFISYTLIDVSSTCTHKYAFFYYRRNRYTAYRQLVRWCWGYLGRNVRVPLPACAVTKIRHTFSPTSTECSKTQNK